MISSNAKNYTAIITCRAPKIRIISARRSRKKGDKKFDDSQEDVLEYFDTSKIRMINEEPKRVNIDFPSWMVKALDKEAKHIGSNRQAVIKMWLAERLQKSTTKVVMI